MFSKWICGLLIRTLRTIATNMSTFFDAIPADELTAIVQHCAKGDRARLRDVHSLLFASESALSRALPICFNTLRIGSITKCDVLKGEITVNVLDEDSGDVMRVLRCCGRVFDTVIFGDYKGGEPRIDIGRVIEEFVEECAELRLLLTAERNSSLENRTIEAMTRIGGRLHVVLPTMEVIDRIGTWSKLKRFTWRGNDTAVLNTLWRRVGDTLEEVELLCPVYSEKTWAESLNLLQTHCRKLTRIVLQDPMEDSGVTEEMYGQFLTSYGEQLRYVSFCSNGLSCKFYEYVAKHCTRLRCGIDEDRNRFELVAALGNIVEGLSLRLYEMNDTSAMADAILRCRHIVKLDVLRHDHTWLPMNVEYIEALFASRLRWLRALSIHCIVDRSSLKHIANGTCNLRTINLTFLTLTTRLDEFREIANANALLEHVTIEEVCENDEANGQVVEVIEELLDVFEKCRRLEYMKLYFYATKLPVGCELRNVCSKYRLRTFNINISFRDAIFAPHQTLKPER